MHSRIIFCIGGHCICGHSIRVGGIFFLFLKSLHRDCCVWLNSDNYHTKKQEGICIRLSARQDRNSS